jgi:hypothetical protein
MNQELMKDLNSLREAVLKKKRDPVLEGLKRTLNDETNKLMRA